MPYAIEVFSLTKRFPQRRTSREILLNPFKKKWTILVLDDVNFKVEKGEVFCLVGPNGSGKTTLIKILSGLILPTSGKADIFGYDVVRDENKVKGFIGLVTSDERSFFWRLSGRENLLFFASLYNLNGAKAKMKIENIMERLEIDEPEKRFQEYSTGVRQRLAIARSLLGDPEILFMDEPTKSLDPISAENLRNFIKSKLVKEQKKTIFFTTHQLNEAEKMADRLAIIDKGRIKAIGRLEDLKTGLNKPNPSLEEVYSFYVNP